MKVRQGFVSNSSSSSFIILRKNDKLTEEEIKENNIKKIQKYDGDYGYDDIKEYQDEILFVASVEYGAEEDVEDIVNKFSEVFKETIYMKSFGD